MTSILNLIGGTCFLIAGIINSSKEFSLEAPVYALYLNRYGFYIAAVCLLIAGVGFMYSYFKNSRKTTNECPHNSNNLNTPPIEPR